jgi:hypothetical protein
MTTCDLKSEILKSFNVQFAVNQNNHQSLFIQFLSILLTVIIGFGVALILFGANNPKEDYQVGLLEFTIAFCVSEGILFLGVALVSALALGFRRDQLINATIREKAMVTEDTATLDEWRVFPISFNPAKNYQMKMDAHEKLMWIKWMPNFHVIFAITLFAFQLFLVLAYLLKLIDRQQLFTSCPLDIPSLILGILAIIFVCPSIPLVRMYHDKVRQDYHIPTAPCNNQQTGPPNRATGK